MWTSLISLLSFTCPRIPNSKLLYEQELKYYKYSCAESTKMNNLGPPCPHFPRISCGIGAKMEPTNPPENRFARFARLNDESQLSGNDHNMDSCRYHQSAVTWEAVSGWRQWSSGQVTQFCVDSFWNPLGICMKIKALTRTYQLQGQNNYRDFPRWSHFSPCAKGFSAFLSELGTVGETLCWSIPKLLKSPSTQVRPRKTQPFRTRQKPRQIPNSTIKNIQSWCMSCMSVGETGDCAWCTSTDVNGSPAPAQLAQLHTVVIL